MSLFQKSINFLVGKTQEQSRKKARRDRAGAVDDDDASSVPIEKFTIEKDTT